MPGQQATCRARYSGGCGGQRQPARTAVYTVSPNAVDSLFNAQVVTYSTRDAFFLLRLFSFSLSRSAFRQKRTRNFYLSHSLSILSSLVAFRQRVHGPREKKATRPLLIAIGNRPCNGHIHVLMLCARLGSALCVCTGYNVSERRMEMSNKKRSKKMRIALRLHTLKRPLRCNER